MSPVTKFFGAGSELTWFFNWNKNYGAKLFPGDGGAKQTIDARFIPMLYVLDLVLSGWGLWLMV